MLGGQDCIVTAVAGHQFYHKWATLMDPRDFQSGPKGYIKCDISVSVSGQPVKVRKPSIIINYPIQLSNPEPADPCRFGIRIVIIVLL